MLLLDMAYWLLREFRQAFTHLDTPPLSNRRHPDPAIARNRQGCAQAASVSSANVTRGLGQTFGDRCRNVRQRAMVIAFASPWPKPRHQPVGWY